MTLINMLRPPRHRQWLRRLRKRLANREHSLRVREARKLCCVVVGPRRGHPRRCAPRGLGPADGPGRGRRTHAGADGRRARAHRATARAASPDPEPLRRPARQPVVRVDFRRLLGAGREKYRDRRDSPRWGR